MDRLEKGPDEIADAMAKRLDNPSMRAQSRPEDDPALEIKYGYRLLPAGALAYEYGFGFFTPLLVLSGSRRFAFETSRTHALQAAPFRPVCCA